MRLRRHTAKWIWMEMVSRRLSYGHLQIRQQKVEDISIRSMLTMMQKMLIPVMWKNFIRFLQMWQCIIIMKTR